MINVFKSSLISEIQINDVDINNKIYITLDVDWACDEVMCDTIELLERYNSKATFFITHTTPILNRLRQNKNIELGIHPNFNFLLNGSLEKGKDYREVISSLLKIVPEAKSVRSHSMTQNSNILQAFTDFELTHDCNHFISVSSQIELKPWYLWNGLVRCPYFWEDDVHIIEKCNLSVYDLINFAGLKIFDFHPIHIFLNTEKLDRYEQTRSIHQKPKELIKHRFEGYGTRNRFIELLQNIN